MISSQAVTLSTTAEPIAVGQGHPYRLYLVPSAATVLIGSASAQTFPLPDPSVNPAPTPIHISPGETLYAKSSSGTPTVHVLETGCSTTPAL